MKIVSRKMAVVIAAVAMLSGMAQAAFAEERAAVTEDGTVVGEGKIKVQSGFELKHFGGETDANTYSVATTVKYGYMKGLELSGSLPLTVTGKVPENRPGSVLGIEDLTVAGKYQIYSEKIDGFDGAVKAFMVVPLGQSDKLMGQQLWQTGVRGIATKTIGNDKIGWVTLGGVAGATVSERHSSLLTGASATVGPKEGAHVYLEGVAYLMDGKIKGGQTIGASYPVMPGTSVDVALKANPVPESKDSNNSVTAGVTMMF